MTLNIKHYMNPLHVYCRLRDMGFPKGKARSFCEAYENSFFRCLFARQTKRCRSKEI